MDLSAFYVDVTKDRMYTFGAKSEARRSGQTAMFIIVDGLARLLAPILSVTMDELWRMLPGEREESVHMALFPRDLEQWKDAALLERWAALVAVRDQVNLQLEEKRQGQDDHREPLGARRASTPTATTATLLERLSRRSCRRCSACRRWTLKPAGPQARKPQRSRCRRDGRRHQVRALLALRAGGQRGAGSRGLCPRCVDALAEPVSL